MGVHSVNDGLRVNNCTLKVSLADNTFFFKTFSCSNQLRVKFVLLINFKLLTIANSFLLNIAEQENFSADKYENANYCWQFHINSRENFMLG